MRQRKAGLSPTERVRVLGRRAARSYVRFGQNRTFGVPQESALPPKAEIFQRLERPQYEVALL